MKAAIFFIVFCLSGLTQATPADALIKPSKKDECTMCHVLWMDVFRTDQPTLLGPVQNNIVIAGSIGLSSSKKICDSCHDGYVKDSRNMINAGNKHHQLKEVPDWLELPQVLRLDINNKIYCGTCHGFHDVRGMGEVGNTPFMRMDNNRSQMCMTCHQDRMDRQGIQNHPLNVKLNGSRRENVENLGGKVGPDGEVICQSCHLPHKKPPLLAPLKGSKICLVCHGDKKTIFASDHNMAITYPKMKNSEGANVAETGLCSSCHLPHNGKGKRMWARKLDNGYAASQACLSCHNLDMWIKTTGNHSHPVGVETERTGKLPLFPEQDGEDEKKLVQCATCHDPHTWSASGSKYVKNMEGRAENSFLRIDNSSSELCLTCHDDKKSLVGTDHDLRLTAPEVTNRMGLSAGVAGPCGSCHMPHKAAGVKLWARKAVTGNPVSAICLTCHGKETQHIQKTVGKYSHPVNVKPEEGKDGGGAFPLFADNGTMSSTGSLQCATCHNPHRWNPKNAKDIPNEKVEGDSSNSFLRMSNNRSALCNKCHVDKKQVLASDHNLGVTAPDEKNIMDRKASRSGPCDACHVPHNAATQRLWAKEVPENKDFVSSLCFSCHNEGGAASEKLINDNSHPVNATLISLKPSGDIERVLPLYRDEDDDRSEGKVVCSTCHDPHSWEPGKNKGEQEVLRENVEGDGASSFLRIASSPNSDLCRKCHETQALVVGSPHDMKKSAPAEQNILGQTVKESGSCAACHLVHNSPNNLKMWARSYGPVKRYENRMIGLCTSCHAEGRVAEKKVQKIANHPKGILTSFKKGFLKVIYNDTGYEAASESCGASSDPTVRYTPILINNIVGFSSGKGYTPIFSDDGQEVNMGTISCPSCHDVHVWNRKLKEQTGAVDGEGPDGFKFLRTQSAQLVCKECHGPDAIFRYLYFHSRSSRTKDGIQHQDRADRFIDFMQ